MTLETGDGLMIPAGTAHTNRNAGEEPAVLLAAVILPVDAGPPPRAAGVTLLWLASGVPAAAGRNAVTLERVTLAPGAAIRRRCSTLSLAAVRRWPKMVGCKTRGRRMWTC